jgi:gluconolactonase
VKTGAPRLAKLATVVDSDAVVELLAGGFKFAEGPIWHPRERCLLFSDIAGDARHRWTEDGGVDVVRRPNGMGNGMTFDADLNLLICEHATSSVVRDGPDGSRATVASHYQGKELNSPNDIVVRSDGSVYFTDPIYGRRPFNGIERPFQLAFCGVYRIPPGGGDLQLVANDFGQPNGLCFSVDESLLYVDDTPRAHIRVFRVRPDGSLDGGEPFATGIGDGTPRSGGWVDGIKCDEAGNIWVTGPRGIWVFSSGGEHLGIIEVPEVAANLHWGGDDWHSLFVTARTSLYRIRTRVTGHREPFMA